MSAFTPAQVARITALATADQAAAREREFDRRATRAAGAFLLVAAVLGAYAVLALAGVVPAMPWSPAGRA